MKLAILEETLSNIADMALFLEDCPAMAMGESYSVNINFRREGQRLYVSLESYGSQHRNAAKEFSVRDLRQEKRTRNTLVGAVAAFFLALGMILLFGKK